MDAQAGNENYHFQLLDDLKKLQKANDINIIVSEIIIDEWKRNKIRCEDYINKLKNQLKNGPIRGIFHAFLPAWLLASSG